MAKDRGGNGSATVTDKMKMSSMMESPLTAQKSGPEQGPSAPSGEINFMPRDPLGICPGGDKK